MTIVFSARPELNVGRASSGKGTTMNDHLILIGDGSGGGGCGKDDDCCNEGADEGDDKCVGEYVRKAPSSGMVVFSSSAVMNSGTGVVREEEISGALKGGERGMRILVAVLVKLLRTKKIQIMERKADEDFGPCKQMGWSE
ncbi:hypothetical protein L484_021945 [Morus notabilis]|uniref:Uncharacterized protein n=1 Tax=Morus notabilis TaxID=981085 RepID=W9QUW3_9ROSA|nr:hypothetical protein L484_021945 [Morus notabilis]